ncbi:MAG: MauE/DoxX family redox-associated membrane protein [Phycisphaerales bacterium]
MDAVAGSKWRQAVGTIMLWLVGIVFLIVAVDKAHFPSPLSAVVRYFGGLSINVGSSSALSVGVILIECFIAIALLTQWHRLLAVIVGCLFLAAASAILIVLAADPGAPSGCGCGRFLSSVADTTGAMLFRNTVLLGMLGAGEFLARSGDMLAVSAIEGT